MEILGALPKLMLLSLDWGSYSGEILVFKTGVFPNLKKLDISDNLYIDYCLKEVKFEDGTSPHLERIDISCCRLESGITGIKHLPRLKEISLSCDCRVAKLVVLQREVGARPGAVDQGSSDAQVEEATSFPSPPSRRVQVRYQHLFAMTTVHLLSISFLFVSSSQDGLLTELCLSQLTDRGGRRSRAQGISQRTNAFFLPRASTR